MERQLYIYNAAGVDRNGINAKDYPIPRDYHFAKDANDPNIDFSKYVYNELGFDANGLDCYGIDELGCDVYARYGRDKTEFDQFGYDENNLDIYGHKRPEPVCAATYDDGEKEKKKEKKKKKKSDYGLFADEKYDYVEAIKAERKRNPPGPVNLEKINELAQALGCSVSDYFIDW